MFVNFKAALFSFIYLEKKDFYRSMKKKTGRPQGVTDPEGKPSTDFKLKLEIT